MILTKAQARTGAQALGEDNMRRAGRMQLSLEDRDVGKRAYRRFLLLVPVEDGGLLGRFQGWLITIAGFSEQDLSDMVYGRIEEEYRATLSLRATAEAAQ